MSGKKRVKKISTIAVAGAMSVNAFMPYSYLQVEAAENTQDHSKTGGTANNTLEQKLADALTKSNKGADQIVEATYKNFTTLSSATNKTTTSGTYKVTGLTTMTNWTITGDVTVYVPSRQILSVVASEVELEQNGNVALKIASGAHLTIVGEGGFYVVGGNGGAGTSRGGQATGTGHKVTGQTGGAGRIGGSAITNSGTFEVSKLFDGQAIIAGGNGGNGGKGQDVAKNEYLSTDGFVGGTGGQAGAGAAAITNTGEIIINGDNVTKDGTIVGNYGQGNINIKGGQGGRGGEGGTAYGARVSWTREGTQKQTEYSGKMVKDWVGFLHEDKPDPEDGYYVYWHGEIGEAKDVATLYPATAGSAGETGQGGVGIYGGTLTMNGGLASVEGGNANVSLSAGNGNAKPGYISGTSLEGISSKYGLQSIENWSKNPAYNPDEPDAAPKFVYADDEYKTKVSVNKKFTVACVYAGGTTSNVGNFALYGVTLNRNSGTLHAFAGTSVNTAIYGGAQNGSGGTFYAGGATSNGFSGNQAATTALQLAQLEGTGTASDGTDSNASNAKNFYVLNEGDTYYDANGKLLTSKGILVYKNGAATPSKYGSKDVFVNAQGYVYLSGVSASDVVELQVAIGGKRIGDAGSASKYVSSDTGIYTFKGSVGTGSLQATFASDTSSMDMEWLAAQMADDFSGSYSGDQVEIDSPYKLAAFAYAVNNGIDGAANAHVKLTSNIDLKAMVWTPIGTKTNPFIGVFDGNGKTIKNMRIQTMDTVDAYGLFGHVKGTQDGKNITSVIKDFTLTNGAYVSNAGAKTAKVNGGVGAATSGGGYSAYATYKVETSGNLYAGAVAGYAENAAFSDIRVENLPMSVTSTSGDVHLGGLVGYDGILKDAQAQNIKTTTVINSTLTTVAKDNAYVGGIVGESGDVDFSDVYHDMQNVGTGGKQSTANMSVKADSDAYVGGLVGKAYSTIDGINREISNGGFDDAMGVKRKIDVDAKGNVYVGGIVGDACDMELRSIRVSVGSIKANSTNKDVYNGGIVGRSEIDKTTYRAIADSSVTFSGGANNFAASAKGNAYMGGVAGYSNHTDSTMTTIKDMAPMEVIAETGKAYVGGHVGYAKEAVIGSGTINITQDIKASGKRGAWASGSLGYGLEASITTQMVSMKGIYADATTGSPAYAGGVVGQISNKSADKKSNAVLSNSEVKFIANGTIQAKSGGLSQPAFAGGILGDAINVNVYGNKVNEGTAKMAVNAFSEDGTSYAGGMAGRIDNSATSQKISISDTTMNNMSITASNAAGDASGKEAYGGGIAGKAIADEVVVMNTVVKGTSDVSAKASFDVYAGRLFGHTVRATILNSAPSAGSSISATSIGGDAYAAGLIGRLDEKIGKAKEQAYQSTISMSGVAKTNVTANAGASKTAYAGSLLGDAQYVLLQKSSVNEGINVTGAQSIVSVSGMDAYVGGIAGRIVNPSTDKLAYNSVSATSVKTQSDSATGSVKQAGMYGQINNVFIASSYAKNYLNTHGSHDDSLYGGLFADAQDIRMIQSYGSRGNAGQTGIDTTGSDAGLAAKLSGHNQFYGVYSTETKWAFDASGNVIDTTHQGADNTFKSTYYSGSGDAVTAGSSWGSTTTWGASNYAQKGDLFELKEKDEAGKYYDSLSAVAFGSDAQKNNISNAMRNLLHFTANTHDDPTLNDISNNQDITTSYEQEVDYRLSYVSKQGNTVAGNFNFPTFSEPYFLTLAVTPSDEYGKVSDTSSITVPGSKKFGKNSTLNFTAIAQDVPEENSFWYEFGGWSIQKRTLDADGNVVLSKATDVKLTASGSDLTFDMPGYDAVLTANFVQKDNSIRRNINKEIHERSVAEINRRSNLAKDDPQYIDPKNIDKTTLKNIFTEVGTDVLGKYVGTGSNSYRKNIASTYDKIAVSPYDAYTTYDALKDPDRVLQQIAGNLAEEAFASSEYKYVMEDGALSIEELEDVRVDVNDTFTSKGDFKDYVAKQLVTETNTDMVPSIIATEGSEDGHLQGVINRPFKGEGTTLEYSFTDPATNEVTWTSAGDGDKGYVNLDSKEAAGADAVYLRNVDKDGFEVITRVPLSRITTDVNNEKINSDTTNTESGAVGVNDSGAMESLIVNGVELLKSSNTIEIAGGDKDKGDYYYAVTTSPVSGQQTLIHGLPKQGAYLNSFTIEVNGKTMVIDENTSIPSDGTIVFEGVTFTVKGERFKNKDYTSEETLSFPADANVKVTSTYVNLLGEINAANEATSAQRTKEQISAILEQEHFKDIFVDTSKDAPTDVADAKDRYDAMSDTQQKLVQEKLALFIPKDALGDSSGYRRAEFIDIFNAITNIVYVEGKLDVDAAGEITAIKKDDFTSGTWNNVADALKRADNAMTGNLIENDGSAKEEAKALLESSALLEEAVKGLTYKVQTFTLSTNHEELVKVEADKGKDSPALLKSAALLAEISSEPYTNLIKFPYQHSDVVVTFAKQEMDAKGLRVSLRDEKGNAILEEDGTLSDGVKNVEVVEKEGALIVTFKDITESKIYTATVAKKQYTIAIPNEEHIKAITNDAQKDKDGNLINLEGTNVQVEDRTDAKDSTYTLHLESEDGYRFNSDATTDDKKASYTYVDTDGTTKTAYVVIDEKGNLKLPNEHLATLKDLDVSNAIRGLDKSDLEEAILKNYDEKEYTEASYKEWKDAHDKASVVAKDPDASFEDINTAYKELINAENALIAQYEISVADGLMIPKQDGVRELDGKFYVTEGYGVYVATNADKTAELKNAHQKLDSVSYEVDGTSLHATLKSDGYSAYLPSIMAPVTNVSFTTSDQAINIVENGMKDDAGKDVKTSSQVATQKKDVEETIYHAPNVKAEHIKDTPIAITTKVTGLDANGLDTFVNIAISGLDASGSGLDVDGNITVTTPDGTTVEIPLTSLPLDKITSTPDSGTGDATVAVDGALLDAILEAFANERPALEVSGTYTVDEVSVSSKAADDSISTSKLPSGDVSVVTNADEVKKVEKDVPSYVVTPEESYVMNGVKVDGTVVNLPDEALLKTIISSGKKTDNGDGTATYTYSDPSSKTEYKATTDSKDTSDVKDIRVTPDGKDYDVIFNTDKTDTSKGDTPETHIKDSAYGEAVVSWNTPDVDAHVVEGSFAKKEFDITSDAIAKGTITTDTTSVKYGEDATLTMTPDTNSVIEPTKTITVEVNGTTITGTLDELAKREELEVKVNKDKDGAITSAIITTKDTHTDINVSVEDGFFRSNQPSDILKDQLLPAIEKLKDDVAIADAILKQKDDSPYVVGDQPYKNMEADYATSKDMLDKLTKEDGTLLDEIKNAKSEKDMMDAIVQALGKDTPIISIGDVQNKLNATSSELETTIANLNAKEEGKRKEQIVVTLPDHIQIGKDASGLDTDVTPMPSVMDKNTPASAIGDGTSIVTDGKQNLVIQPILVISGNEVSELTMKVKNPDSGEEKTITIPLAPSAGDDTLVIAITDKDGKTTNASISASGIYPMLTHTDGTSAITLPGDVLDDIFKAGFGSDVSAGIVEELTIAKTTTKSELAPNSDTVTSDGGIKDTTTPVLKSNETTADGTTTIHPSDGDDRIDPAKEGISVEDIETRDEFALKGITVSVVDEKDELHQIFVPSTTTNTSDSASGVGKDITITNDELQEAIKKELGKDVDLDKISVVDVSVNTTAPLTSKETTLAKAEKVNGLVVDTKDTSGEKVSIIVPVDGDNAPDKVVVEYQKDGKTESIEVPLTSVAGTISTSTNADGKEVVNISGTMVEDILAQIASDADAKDKVTIEPSAVVSSKDALLKERVANEVPEAITAGKGIQAKLDKTTSLSGSDTGGGSPSTADNHLLEKDEHLRIQNIEPSEGYTFDGASLTIKGLDNDGKEITKKVVVNVDKDGTNKVFVDGKEIIMPKDGLVTTLPDGSGTTHGSMDFSKEALETIYKELGVSQSATGIYDADITDILVSATLTDTDAIAMPEVVDVKDSHNLDPDTTVDITITPSTTAPTITIPSASATDIVKATVEDVNGTKVEVNIDYSDPDNPHIYVETESGKSTVEVALPDGIKDGITTDGGHITKISGDALADIIASYNEIAAKDIEKSGAENVDTIPLEFPKLRIDTVVDGSGNDIKADVSEDRFVEGALRGNEDITISPVKVKPAHQLEDVVVTTTDKLGNEITIKVPVTPNPESTSGVVNVTVKEKDSDKTYEYKIPSALLDEVRQEEKDGLEITLPGSLITDILDKTIAKDTAERPSSTLTKETNVTSVALDAVRNGIHVPDSASVDTDGTTANADVSIISRKDDKESDEAVLLPSTTDLLIKNIAHEEGSRPDEVTLTLKNDAGEEYQVAVPVPAKEGVITAILPDGTTTTLDIKSDTHPDGIDLSDMSLKEGTSDEVRVPGKALEEIMEKLSGSAATDMDITAVAVNVSKNTWQLPLSEDIVKRTNTSTTGVKEVDSIVLKSDGKVETSLLATDKKLSVDKNGSFTIMVAYGEDDYSTVNTSSKNFPHVYNGLIVNDINLSKKQLEGIVTARLDGSLEIDTAKLSAKVAELSGKEFDGFHDLQVQTIPTNPQYKTFKNEYLGLDSMNANSTEYEAMVEKLLSQFDKTSANPDTLSADNMNHLIDYKADLEARAEKIEEQKKIDDLAQRIKDTYEAMDKAIDAADGTTKEGLPFAYGIDEKIDGAAIHKVEDYRGQVEALEKEYLAYDNETRSAINDKIVGKAGEANKLDQMLEAIEEVDIQTLGKAGVVNKLLDKLLAETMADIVDDAQNPTAPDTYANALGKVDSLDDMTRQIDKINTMIAGMTSDELKDVASTKRQDLNKLQANVQEEYTDFANLFVKEYLTQDNNVYVAGSDGTSANSVNGYSEATYKAKASETKQAVMDAKKEFNKLSEEAKKAIGLPDETSNLGVFHGPTLNELFASVVDSVSAIDVLIDEIDTRYDALIAQATTQAEKDSLTQIRNQAIADLQAGKDTKQESFIGDALTSIVKPSTSTGSLGDISYEGLDRRVDALDTSITYTPDGAPKAETIDVHIEYASDGSVSAITYSKDGGSSITPTLTPEQLDALKQTIPAAPTSGSVHIAGTVLEEVLGIKDVLDKAITKVDVTLGSLSVPELTAISEQAIKDMDTLVKNSATQELINETQALKDKINGYLNAETNTLLDEQLKLGQQLIANSDADNVHNLVNAQVERMKDIIYAEITKELAEDFAKNAEGVSDEGKKLLEEVYQKALDNLRNSKDDIDNALDILVRAQLEMVIIHNENPKGEEKPDVPEPTPDTPVEPDKPQEQPGSNDPIKPQFPSGTIQGVSRPGSNTPKYEIIYDELSGTLKKSDASTSIKELKKEYDRIQNAYAGYKGRDGYEKLNKRLKEIYEKAVKDLENASDEERATILENALKEMAEVEKEFKALQKQNTATATQKEAAKETSDASWFNLVSILILLAGAVVGFMKRHRFMAILGIDLLAGVILLGATQGIALADLAFTNSYSIYFAALCVLDAILLFALRNKKKDKDDKK